TLGTLGLPPPHVCPGPVQAPPQLTLTPQLLITLPQFFPEQAAPLSVHPQTLGTLGLPPPHVCPGPVQVPVPQVACPPQPLGTVPQFLPEGQLMGAQLH
ncbi:MAG: hypothetical protein AAB649_05470, partial [Patescibacteria group bacterium]